MITRTSLIPTGTKAQAICATAILAALGLAGGASAYAGWTPDKAERQLRTTYIIVLDSEVAEAKENLERARRIGGTHGIENAKRELVLVKRGYRVETATCVGTRKAAGGWVRFRCRVALVNPFDDVVRLPVTLVVAGTSRYKVLA